MKSQFDIKMAFLIMQYLQGLIWFESVLVKIWQEFQKLRTSDKGRPLWLRKSLDGWPAVKKYVWRFISHNDDDNRKRRSAHALFNLIAIYMRKWVKYPAAGLDPIRSQCRPKSMPWAHPGLERRISCYTCQIAFIVFWPHDLRTI